MAIKLTIELIRFLNAAKRLYDQGLMGKEEILNEILQLNSLK